MVAIRWIAAVGLTLLAAPLAAQDTDSTRALHEVVVSGAVEARGVLAVPIAGILARDPVSVADVARLIPSATASTNSRGETLLAIRGAGERQTAVLLDGAPLTVPWDRRLDLALLPAGVIGRLDVVRGPASLVWGPHAAGGSLDLVPRALATEGTLTDAEAHAALPVGGRLAATVLHRRGAWLVTAAADGHAHEGAALAGSLPYNQSDTSVRTNSDRWTASALARVVVAPRPGTEVAATVLHLDAGQGVAPEGHLDPLTERVRYWRIPEWRHTTLVVRARAPLAGAGLDVTTWGSLFGQTIRQFPDATYTAPDGGQQDRDASVGTRVVAETVGPLGALRAIGWGLLSTHRETDLEPDAVSERFRSAEGRLGLEAERTVGGAAVLAGVGLDVVRPTDAGGREVGPAFRSLSLVARAEGDLRGARVHAGVARTGRFPTLRELYGEALGRFVLTPDLRPETMWQADVGLGAMGRRASVRAAVFARHAADTIEPEVLPDGRRRRVNLGSSRAVGVEAEGALRIGSAGRLDASGTLLHLRAQSAEGVAMRLSERPAALGRLSASVVPPRGWTGAAEMIVTGPAVTVGREATLDLPASVLLSVRAGYRWALRQGLVETSLRVDNATNALHFPQAGLPAPGREVRLNVRWSGWSAPGRR